MQTKTKWLMMPSQKEKDTKGLLLEVEGSKLCYHTRPQGIYSAPLGPVGISPAQRAGTPKGEKDTSKSKIKL